MRIAIVSEYYYPQLGGITEHVYGQASELSRRGHDVTVITPKLVRVKPTVDGHPDRPENFEVMHVGRAFPFYINASEAVLAPGTAVPRAYAKRDFDVVHVHNPWGVALPIVAIMRSRAKVTVGTIHSVVPEGYKLLRIFRGLLQIPFTRLDARIVVSSAVIDSIQRHFPRLDFDVIPNGVDTSFFSPAAEPLPQFQDGKRNIVFIGRFDPRNGLKHVLRAFTILRETRDDTRLIVIGDGQTRPIYERMIPAELRHDVHFEGRVDGLRPRYLATADVACIPCQLASFGMVLLEAMSVGVPVVASSISGFRMLMRDGVDGLLVDPSDDDAQFAEGLHRLLDDSELARRMGASGRERSVSTYSWPVVADQLEELYTRLLAQRQ